MNNLSEQFGRFSQLIEQGRLRESFTFFLRQIAEKNWFDFSTPELAMLDKLCSHTLAHLRQQHTLWLVEHPDRLRRMLEVLSEALAAKYRPASTIDHIIWFRCLLAIKEAAEGHTESAYKQLSLVGSGLDKDNGLPKPNGRLREHLKSIELSETASSEFLKMFFAGYLEFLQRIGEYELSNQLKERLSKLLKFIARDEKRPGVVQAMFYDKLNTDGLCSFIHVSIKRLSNQEKSNLQQEGIEYVRQKEDVIDASMKQAADYARMTADTYLKRSGYPDGLDKRGVIWEIATVEGDVTGLEKRFQGGSVALPLAVAIVSEYLAKPVANDIALTGAFTEISKVDGQILPVDGVREKVEHAVTSGCKLVYIPSANSAEIDDKPSLRNLISEKNSHVKPIGSFDEVCG